ncbi:MAG: hypothetical protein ACE5HA_06635 [Anaerolineae bacterium]
MLCDVPNGRCDGSDRVGAQEPDGERKTLKVLETVTTQPLPPDRQIRRLKERNRGDPVALGLDLTIQAEQAE